MAPERKRLPTSLMAAGLAGLIALGGCATDGGYGGMDIGVGYGGYSDYYDPYYGPAGYPGYYGGWYNDFYYPGGGYYVFDRGGRRHRWTDGQRSYWEHRRRDGGQTGRPGWQGGDHRPGSHDGVPGNGGSWQGGGRGPGWHGGRPQSNAPQGGQQSGQTYVPRQPSTEGFGNGAPRVRYPQSPPSGGSQRGGRGGH